MINPFLVAIQGIGTNPLAYATDGFIGAVEEVFSGGWEHYKYRPRVRFKFKDEEERKAAKVIEQILETRPIDSTDVELELALRLRLQYQEIAYKKLYLKWMEQEFNRLKAARIQLIKKRTAYLLLLH